MVIEGCKDLIIKCSLCNRLKEYEFNLFNVMKYDKIEYECSCGEIIKVSVEKGNLLRGRAISFKSRKASFKFSLHNILKNQSICRYDDGSLVFFLGQKDMGRKKLKKLGLQLDDIVTKFNRNDIFVNFDIITRALIKLFDLEKQDRIQCDCGNTKISIELFYDRIELKCLNCNGVKLIFAETEEDLKVILDKDRINLRKSDISCIDSIIDNNKHINK